jgi:hypothetical protein
MAAAVPSGIPEPSPLPGANDDMGGKHADAMSRLAERVNGVVDNTYHAEGFEASVHKIKEQVLPACSNASTPKPPPRSPRMNCRKNSARSSWKCWPS